LEVDAWGFASRLEDVWLQISTQEPSCGMATTSTTRACGTEQEAALFEKLRLLGMKVKPKDAWKNSFGWAKDNPDYDEAMRLGAEWRAEVNRKSLAELDALDAGS
jgi:hypothetical protein